MMTGIEIIVSVVLGLLGIALLWAVYKKKISIVLKEATENGWQLIEFGLIVYLVVGFAYSIFKLYKWVLPKSWVYPALQITMTVLGIAFLVTSVWMWL